MAVLLSVVKPAIKYTGHNLMMHGVKVLVVMSWSLLPLLRVAAAMHDGGDDDDRFLRDAKNTVRFTTAF